MEKITKAQARKWSKALRSGKFAQGHGQLEENSGEYCCLGVACKIFIPKKQLIIGTEEDDDNDSFIDVLRGYMPNEQDNSPEWLKTVDTDFKEKMGICLFELNDDKEFSFDEIADVIDLVYVFGALD